MNTYGIGNLWNTDLSGVASPQVGRPVLTGGLQQMQMLQALRGGMSGDQLQALNPYTARPTQFLPQALPNFDYAGQYRDALAAEAARAAAARPMYATGPSSNYGGGGPGGGDGSAGSASSDGGADGSAGAVGGGEGGGGGGGGGSK